MIHMASFYVGMYLVKIGTEPRNHIRNQILQYRVIRIGVNGQNGHFQKDMISLASFLGRNVPCHERNRTM